jgi:hypothetical protein
MSTGLSIFRQPRLFFGSVITINDQAFWHLTITYLKLPADAQSSIIPVYQSHIPDHFVCKFACFKQGGLLHQVIKINGYLFIADGLAYRYGN